VQLEAQCKQLLAALRRERPRQPSYLAGNLLNLLLHLDLVYAATIFPTCASGKPICAAPICLGWISSTPI